MLSSIIVCVSVSVVAGSDSLPAPHVAIEKAQVETDPAGLPCVIEPAAIPDKARLDEYKPEVIDHGKSQTK